MVSRGQFLLVALGVILQPVLKRTEHTNCHDANVTPSHQRVDQLDTSKSLEISSKWPFLWYFLVHCPIKAVRLTT